MLPRHVTPAWLAVLCLSAACLASGCRGKDEPTYRGMPVSHWQQELTNPAPDKRLAAVEALTGLGNRSLPALPAVTAALVQAIPLTVSPSEVLAVARALVATESPAPAAVPLLQAQIPRYAAVTGFAQTMGDLIEQISARSP